MQQRKGMRGIGVPRQDAANRNIARRRCREILPAEPPGGRGFPGSVRYERTRKTYRADTAQAVIGQVSSWDVVEALRNSSERAAVDRSGLGKEPQAEGPLAGIS